MMRPTPDADGAVVQSRGGDGWSNASSSSPAWPKRSAVAEKIGRAVNAQVPSGHIFSAMAGRSRTLPLSGNEEVTSAEE